MLVSAALVLSISFVAASDSGIAETTHERDSSGWRTLRFGDTKETATEMVRKLFADKKDGLQLSSQSYPANAGQQSPSVEVLFVYSKRSVFPEFDKLGQVFLSGGTSAPLGWPSLALSFAHDRLYKIVVDAAYKAEASDRSYAKAQGIAFEMKNIFGGGLPNLACRDTSQAPKRHNGEIISGGATLDCRYQLGRVTYASTYMFLNEPKLGLYRHCFVGTTGRGGGSTDGRLPEGAAEKSYPLARSGLS